MCVSIFWIFFDLILICQVLHVVGFLQRKIAACHPIRILQNMEQNCQFSQKNDDDDNSIDRHWTAFVLKSRSVWKSSLQ